MLAKAMAKAAGRGGFAGFLRKYFLGRGPLSGGWIRGAVNAFQKEISRVTHQKSFLFGVGA
jgi:hypothetical protein